KKSNGAPNGFYAEIDWDRYVSARELAGGERSQLSFFNGSPPTKGKHFYSSSESEEEEEAHKKFNIKIKPLQAKDVLKSAATVDELKASIGNIALSPSPVRELRGRPGPTALGAGCERALAAARSRKLVEDPAALAPLFGPPLESAFEEQKLEAPLDQPEIWGSAPAGSSGTDSPKLPRPFPTGSKWRRQSPAPRKHRARGHRYGQVLPARPCSSRRSAAGAAEGPAEQAPSINDLDRIFGPVLSPKAAAVDTEDKWVHFSDHPCSARPCRRLALRTEPARLPGATGAPSAPAERPLQQPHGLRSRLAPGKGREALGGPQEPGERPSLRLAASCPQAVPARGSGGPGAPCIRSRAGSPSGPATRCRAGAHPAPCSQVPPPAAPVSLNPLPCRVSPQARPFSPPMHSSSPPPVAPLARAESTSSISSTNSLSAATTPTVENEQPSLVWFDRGKFYLTFEGSSRGPSPLTMGAQDTLPVAAAFTETVNAYFKGADPSKCIVKITGEMVLSFPAGITRHFATNPTPAVLTFRVLNYDRLEHVLPNPQLLCCDTAPAAAGTKEFWVNMPNLMAHLKKVSEQKPQATYYNVDMLKYQVSAQGIQSTPLNLAVSWRCDPASTDLRIDYKYNTEAMTTPVALNNVQFLVPVDGGVTKLQAVLPPAVWNAEQQRILWKIPDISQKSENGGEGGRARGAARRGVAAGAEAALCPRAGVGSLLARFQLAQGPSSPAALALQFTSEGSTLSGCDIELLGAGYRFSLVKKRFAAGECPPAA
ncbi:SGIP1 protein, partial [Nothoprocta pentlandii]|nr:SGIP1 protein [Nothoprocta pentlandii]